MSDGFDKLFDVFFVSKKFRGIIMPKTKIQSFVFTVMMVFFMVFCMTCYTLALNFGELSYNVFYQAIKEMWLEYIIVFLLIFFVITRVAQKLAFTILTPGIDKPIFITIETAENYV